jgi:CCR4-NOT transcriptional regulation complex NOT5 subunit
MFVWGGVERETLANSGTSAGPSSKQNANGNIGNGVVDHSSIRNGGNRTPIPATARSTPDVTISDGGAVVRDTAVHGPFSSVNGTEHPASTAPTMDQTMMDGIPSEGDRVSQGSGPETGQDQDIEMTDS